MEHNLKTIQPFFDDVWSGKKRFELRKNDRNYQIGDTVVLEEWGPDENGDLSYYGRATRKTISYILKDCPEFGLMPEYCIFGW
jgi:hypothetical protein